MVRLWSVLLLSSLPIAVGCSSGSASLAQSQTKQGPTGQVALDLFIDQAKKAGCAETRNRLFLIDQSLVFWERRGLGCPDNSYCLILYGSTPADFLCEEMDSIAGPQLKYHDPSRRAMFDTIRTNLDKADLGLGPGHTVTPVPF